MSHPDEQGCPTCAVLRDEVAWLREELRALRVQPAAPAPAAPVAAPPPGTGLAPLPPEELLRQAGIFADPTTGLAMVMYDGKMIPWTEWNRGQRALDQALAGKPIESEG
jgi:hypothetical protein